MTAGVEPPARSSGIDPVPLIEALSDPALVIDAHGRIRCANARAARLLADRVAPILPLSPEPEEDRLVLPASEGGAAPSEGSLARIHAVLAGEVDQVAIELPSGGPGAPRWSLLVTPCSVDGGPGALLRLSDSAARDATNASLEQARLFLDSIIENIPLIIFVKDSESRFVRVNQHFERFHETPRADVLGKSSWELVPPEQAAHFEAQDHAVFEGGVTVDVAEETITTPGMGLRLIRTRKVPFRDADGRRTYLLGIVEDVTELHKMEEAKRRELVLLETQTRLLELVRELSTPIIPIHPGILVVPLIGQMDSGRSAQLMESLLAGIQRHRAEIVLIDITGVSVVDTAVANHLLQTTRAASLLGASCFLVGTSPEVATTMVALGVDFGSLPTHRDLGAGFRAALARKGWTIAERASRAVR